MCAVGCRIVPLLLLLPVGGGWAGGDDGSLRARAATDACACVCVCGAGVVYERVAWCLWCWASCGREAFRGRACCDAHTRLLVGEVGECFWGKGAGRAHPHDDVEGRPVCR